MKRDSASRLLNQLAMLLSEKAICEPRFDKCRGLQSIANSANIVNYSCKSRFIAMQPHPFIHIYHCCFWVTEAELSSCGRDQMAHNLNISHIALYQRIIANPCTKVRKGQCHDKLIKLFRQRREQEKKP